MIYAAVVGTRHRLPDSERERVLNHLRSEVPMFAHVISGDCPTGVDPLARGFANEQGKACFAIEAPWWLLNKKAGPVRNEIIIRAADQLFAFPCKHSKGTLGVIRGCAKRGVENRGFAVECEEE